jgi:hypothetical protein
MERSTEILSELQEISPLLASIDAKNVLKVPEGYFSALENRILGHVLLFSNKAEESLSVPEGYFESLSDRILSKIKDEDARQEIKTISPMLHYLREENVFSVPANYFEGLSDHIFNRINQKDTKVISLKKVRRIWQYAAAAVVTVAIFIGSLFIFNNNSTTSPEMVATSALPDNVGMSHQFTSTAELKRGIESLSDDEIASYLEQNGSILDNELLINGTDTKSLPDAVDYLSDENTLNDILNQING